MILFVITDRSNSRELTSVNSSYQTSVRQRAELVFNTELSLLIRPGLIWLPVNKGVGSCPYWSMVHIGIFHWSPQLLIILINNVRGGEKYRMFPVDWLTRVMLECKWFELSEIFIITHPPQHFSPANPWIVPILKSVTLISHGLPCHLPPENY